MPRSSRTRLLCLTMLALVLAMTALAGAAARYSFSGRTAQKHSIRFLVRGHSLYGLGFIIDLSCSDGSTVTDYQRGFQPMPIRSDGRFSDVQSGSTDVVRVSGTLKGKAVSGRLRVTDRLSRTVACDSRTVAFTARRR